MLIDGTRTASSLSLRREVHVDSADLRADDRERLTTLIDRLNLDDLERRSPIRGSGADRFQYELHFKDDLGEHNCVIDESCLSPELRNLIELLFNA